MVRIVLRASPGLPGSPLPECGVGSHAPADAGLSGDQVPQTHDWLVQRAGGDQSHQIGNLHRKYSVVMAASLGNPNKVNAAGAGSVSHMASIASLSFCTSCPARSRFLTPSVITDRHHASPKAAAVANERWAKARSGA